MLSGAFNWSCSPQTGKFLLNPSGSIHESESDSFEGARAAFELLDKIGKALSYDLAALGRIKAVYSKADYLMLDLWAAALQRQHWFGESEEMMIRDRSEAEMEVGEHIMSAIAQELRDAKRLRVEPRAVLLAAANRYADLRALNSEQRSTLAEKIDMIIAEGGNDVRRLIAPVEPEAVPEPPTNPHEVATWIKSHRELCGWTQDELAEKANVSRASVTNHECGDKASKKSLRAYYYAFTTERRRKAQQFAKKSA